MKTLVLFLVLMLCWFHVGFSQCNCASFSKEQRTNYERLVDRAEYKRAKNIAQQQVKSTNVNCQVLGWNLMADLSGYESDYISMKKYLDESRKLFGNGACNRDSKMEYYATMALYYFNTNDESSGAFYSLKALKIAEELNDFERQAYIYTYLQNTFNRLGQYGRQLEYARKSVKIVEYLKDYHDQVDLLEMTAKAYRSNFWRLNNQSAIDSAEIYANQLFRLSKKNNYAEGIVKGYELKGEIASMRKKHPLAIAYMDSVAIVLTAHPEIPIREKYDYHRFNTYSYSYLELKNASKAMAYADSLLFIARGTGQAGILIGAYEKCYDAYKAAGKNTEALAFFEQFKRIDDSLRSEDNTAVITELEQKYQKTKSEQRIEKLNQQHEIDGLQIQLLIGLSVLILCLLLVLWSWFRNRNLRQKQQTLETEQRLNRSRMNPHFFFNVIAALQGLAVRNNDGKQVAIQLGNFATLMRKTLEHTYTEWILLDEERAFIDQYLSLERLKSSKLFHYTFDIDDDLDPDNVRIPSMLIQPFVENAITHGFRNINYEGELRITATVVDRQLMVRIADNGSGMRQHEEGKEHISRALQITRDRFYLLRQTTGKEAGFTIGENKPNGVIVDFVLPLNTVHESTSS